MFEGFRCMYLLMTHLTKKSMIRPVSETADGPNHVRPTLLGPRSTPLGPPSPDPIPVSLPPKPSYSSLEPPSMAMASSLVPPPLRLRPFPPPSQLGLHLSSPSLLRNSLISPNPQSKPLKAINSTIPVISGHRRLLLTSVQASPSNSAAAQVIETRISSCLSPILKAHFFSIR